MRQNKSKPPLNAAWLRLATLSVALKLALLACYMVIESIGLAKADDKLPPDIRPYEIRRCTCLKQVADRVGDLDEANASIVAARRARIGQCRDEVAE